MWNRLRQFGFAKLLFLSGTFLIVAYLALVPLFMLLYGSMRSSPPGVPGGEFTLDKFQLAYSNPRIYQSMWNTLIFSLGVTAFACTLGTLLAWITERTNTPLKGLIFLLSVVRIIVPGILTTISWIFLLSPKVGLVNLGLSKLLGIEGALFDVYNIWGMIWVDGLDLTPLAFLLMVAGFRSMDPSLEEASLVAGASRWTTFIRVTLPMALPSFLATLLICMVRGLEAFEVPALLGMPVGIMVFSTEVFRAVRTPPTDLGLANSYSLFYVALSVIGIMLYQRATANAEKFAVITGKGFRPALIDLGRTKYLVSGVILFLLLVFYILPLLVLLWSSLIPFYGIPSQRMWSLVSLENYKYIFFEYPAVARAFKNSFILGTSSATIVMILTAISSWIVVKTRLPGRKILDSLTFILIAIPGLVLGVALIWVYLTVRIGVYGTLWILLIAYSTKYLPYGMRTCYSSMTQIHKELEEASETCGGSWIRTFVRVTLPLLVPGLVTGWIWVMIHSFRELSTSLLLSGHNSEVVAVLIFSMWEHGEYPVLSALAVILILTLGLIIISARWIRNRLGVQVT
ncbi:MAG: iron ABC transporter permease [Candidatus Binatia bacterium]